MAYIPKNYTEQGGDRLVIGGTLEIKEGASVAGITTATIVDNLTSSDTDKALSAKQGKALKDTADALALVVGGKLTATIADNQAASVASTVAGAVADLNALIAKLKAAGLMAADV